MLTLTLAEMNTWIAALLWPLSRILGLIAAAPVFGNASVPVMVRVGLGVMLTVIMAPAIPALPATDPMSLAGLLIVTQQMLIGLAMGFAIRIVFAAVEMAGEVSSLTMGLGFATFFDPQTQGRSSAISQFLALLATMCFVSLNAHQVLLSALEESFFTMPIGTHPGTGNGLRELAMWGGEIFSVGAQLAMPIVAALLVTNVALGILTRAAPQLNIFGIGFPITLGVGFIVMSLSLPYLATPLQNWFNRGIEISRQIPRDWASPLPQKGTREIAPAH